MYFSFIIFNYTYVELIKRYLTTFKMSSHKITLFCCFQCFSLQTNLANSLKAAQNRGVILKAVI